VYEDEYDQTTARYYDAAYATMPGIGEDVDFYRELARETGGPVLELGCGTGRVLAGLAAEGLACTGLDASPAMLAKARERVGEAVRLVRGDMRDFDLAGERFALICSAFRAFQHLLSVDEQLRCLARVRAHLRPGGLFAFDVFKPRPDKLVDDDAEEEEDLRFEQDGEQVVRLARVRRDPVAQTLRVHFRYERRRGDRVLGDDHAAFTMRWFHRFELEHLMARAGFADVRILGDFDGSPIGPDSPAYVVLAR
jgi:SAM-dependent methyltransferase